MMRLDLAAQPCLHENPGNPIARLHARDIGADFHHLAGAIRQRDQVFRRRAAAVAAGGDHQVTIIQAGGAHAHQGLAARRVGRVGLGERERVDAVGLGKFPVPHF